MIELLAISLGDPMGNVCAGSCSCRCKGCAGFRKCNICAGFRKCNCCAGFRKCNFCAGKSFGSICTSCCRPKKEKNDDDKDEEKAAIAHSEPARSSPVQTKPPGQERIVRDSPESSRSSSPVERNGKQHLGPTSPEEKTKQHLVPTSPVPTPSPPPRRVEEQTKPAASPVVTPVATPVTQRAGRDDNTKARTSPESSTSGSSGKTKKPHNVKRRAGSAGLQEGVLQTKTGPLKEYYNLGEKLGQGQFGTTFQCMEKGTGKEYACKSIAKRKLTTREDVEDVRREIQIMHHLSGHPNVITIKGAYEDAVAVHVVMELCKGGELFDRIVERGHYSERKAAELSRVIVGVVQSCHSLGVIHRDLKPENFIFVDGKEDSPIKTIDFGLSVFFKPGDVFHDVVGSPYYVAPEVLNKKYGPEADVWSAGVIIYILLCGVPPFWAEAEEDIFEEVLTGRLDFSEDPWPDISASAKDLLKKMLVRNPKKRMTAHDVLRHPWIQVDGVAPDKPLDSVLRRLSQFSAMNKIKKMALRIIAEKLSVDEIAGLKEMFKMIDTDNSGQITFEELKAGLKAFGANLDDTEMCDLMKAADVDNSGTIDYGEFIAATLHLNKVEREDCLFAAFSYFDKDGSGYITQDELEKACEEFGIKDPRLAEMIQEVDQDNDGRIDYNEFVAMMQNGNFDLGMKGFREQK